MRRGILALLPLAALLSACWQSSAPLIPDAEVDAPNVAGTYTRTATDETDTTTRITKADNGFYNYETLTDGISSDERKLRFDKLSGDWFLIQSQALSDDGNAAAPIYRIMKITRAEIEEYEPGCDASEQVFDGVTVDLDDATCNFTDYKGLKAAAQSRLKRNLDGEIGSLSLEATYRK